MPLTCECPYYEEYDWWWYPPNDYTTLKTSRRKRCVSCNRLIDVGALCTEFERYRSPCTEIEERINCYDQIPLASHYMCEKCSDIYFNLTELRFCIQLGESMDQLLQDYILDYANTNTYSTQIQTPR